MALDGLHLWKFPSTWGRSSMGEQLLCKQKVRSSSLLASTKVAEAKAVEALVCDASSSEFLLAETLREQVSSVAPFGRCR